MALFGIVLLTAESAEAGILRARCSSDVTTTVWGYVYGGSQGELMAECAKRATKPRISEVTDVPCPVSDRRPGCEMGGPFIGAVCAGAPSGPTTVSPALTLGNGQSGRACVSVPSSHPVTKTFCQGTVYRGRNPEIRWCNSLGACEYADSSRMTFVEVGGTKTICWTVTSHHSSQRDYYVYVD
jgi:hypothetical protein